MGEACRTTFWEQTAHLHEHPEAGLVPEMPEADYRDLVEDIRERGVLEPLHVLYGATDERVVLDGRHRLRAARELGLARVPVADVELWGQSPVRYMLLAAVRRRHLTDDQRAMLAEELRQQLTGEAKAQRAAAGGRANLSGTVPDKQEAPPGFRFLRDAEPSSDLPKQEATRTAPRRDTRREAAEAVGLPPESRKLRQAQQVAAASPALAQEVKAGRKTLREAQKEVRTQEAAAAPPTPAAEPEEPPALSPELVETYRIAFSRLHFRDDDDSTAVWTIGRWKLRVAAEIHRLLTLVEEAAGILADTNTRVPTWLASSRWEFLAAAGVLQAAVEEAERTPDAPNPLTAEEALRDALRQGLSKGPAIAAACRRLNYESGRRDWHPFNDLEFYVWGKFEREGVVQKVGGRWRLVEEAKPDPEVAAREQAEDQLRDLGLLPAGEGGGARA